MPLGSKSDIWESEISSASTPPLVKGEISVFEIDSPFRRITNQNKRLQLTISYVCRLSTLQNELSEERGLATALAGSQAQWQEQARLKEQAFMQEVRKLLTISGSKGL